ncbi:hypothetical protein [Paractinoplanes ferrugineus]|nr:hypothetical protein [Actinoplanes ferrugineus]
MTSTFPGQGRFSIYTGRVTNWPMVILSVALTVPLLMFSDAQGWAIAVLVAVALLANLLTGTSVRTTAGPNGVAIRFGVVGWPRAVYRIGEIARAEVVDQHPWRVAYGFWWTPRRTNCTVRSGPALRLILRTGRIVTVSVPDPHAAVAVLGEASVA